MSDVLVMPLLDDAEDDAAGWMEFRSGEQDAAGEPLSQLQPEDMLRLVLLHLEEIKRSELRHA